MEKFRLYLILLITLFSFIRIEAQAMACDGEIELCNGYFYFDGTYGGTIVNFIDTIGYVISFTNNDGNVNEYSGNSQDGIFSFPTGQNLSYTGTYSIANLDNGNICWGGFINTNCSDYLIPPSPQCIFDIEGITEMAPCNILGSSLWPHISKGFCIGDTSRINISPDQEIFLPDSFQPFTLDRLVINNGVVISYDEFGFDVVWDQIGTECILLTTELETGIDYTSAISVNVNDKVDLDIFFDNANPESIELCIGESITLTTESFENISTYWLPENGIKVYENSIDLSYEIPGTYELILSPKSNCDCALPDTIEIFVLPGDVPGIQCTGTICADSEVTYYSDMECDTYIWNVSPEGTIIDGGGSNDFFITIDWNTGPIGKITLTTPGCSTTPCTESVTELIPIIDGSGVIYGPAEVCYGERQEYTLINYTGTDFEWTIDGPGLILGNKRNPIVVQWNEEDPDNTAIISVVFENCNLECSGSAYLDILLLEEIYIDLDDRKFCNIAELNVSNNLGYNVDWSITNPDGSESNFNNIPILNTTLSDVGTYTVRLSNAASPTCNVDDEIEIQIYDNPDPPSEIDGTEVICKNTLIQYTIPDLGAYDIVHWQVFDGSVLDPTNERTARNIAISWTSDGPYKLSASIENSITRCISEATVELYGTDILLTGPDTICIATEYIYTVDPYFGGDIAWSITPSIAAEIIYTQGDFASIVALSNASFTITSTHCDNTAMIEAHVPSFDVSLDYDHIVCKFETSRLEVTAPSGSSLSISTYPENNLVSTSVISELSSGDYLVEVTSPYGCIFSEEILIVEQDTFIVNISSPGPLFFCMPHDPILIQATVLGVGYTYAWYRNGMLLPETSSTLMATEYGSYYVIATDIYGCNQYSDNIFLRKPSGVGPSLDIEKTDISCVDKAFTVLEPYESDTFIWVFGDGSSATGLNVEHTYTRAGYYIVGVIGNGGCDTFTGVLCGDEVTSNSCESGREIVIIPAVANFKYKPACVNEPTQFLDISSILPSTTGLIYSWDFGDPSSGSNTSSQINPTHIYSSPQDYEVTLILTHPQTNCVTEKKLTISVNQTSDVSMDFQVNSCIGYQTYFTGNSLESNIEYFWQFGEVINGKELTSREQNATYTYTTTGNHLVRLTGTNQFRCKTTISQIITISNNTLNGEIATNTEYPKCEGEPVVLTAPVGLTYLWNTNETTNEITVTESGNYSVTVTNAGGCEYTPYPHLVSDVNLTDIIIIEATEYSSTGPSQKTHYDSLIICQGERFILKSNELPNVRYLWVGGISNFANTSVLEYEDNFESLSVGRYEYYLNIRDLDSDCEGEFGPFLLEIVANPEEAVLVSDNVNPCIGDILNVSISNYNPAYNYQWSNGHTGESFTGTVSSRLTVIVTNSNGCSSGSNFILPRSYPSIDAWMTGCMEVCFPREICLRLVDETTDYYLIKDGESIAELSSPTSTLEIDGPGDYQLQAINKYGCSAISEILSLSSSPDDHQLSGIVYIDYNENGLYEPSDSLLEGVIVTLFNGNTAVGTTDTDENGAYLFDPVEHANLTAGIDISNLDQVLIGDLDSLLIYATCVEDKLINFPLISICQNQETTIEYRVCKGESVIVSGVEYYSSDIDTIIYELADGCDSLSIINVLEYIEPEVVTTIDGTCKDSDSGSLYIEILNGSNLSFSIDGMSNLFLDTFAHNLTVGEHLLYIQDANACNYIFPFYIPEIDPPFVDVLPSSSCNQMNNGSIEIDIITGLGLTFSLDENGYFTTDSLIGNLPVGDYILYIRDENNCDYNQLFTIESYLEPEIILEPNGTCYDQIEGNIIINVVSGNELSFSMDSTGNYESITEFNNLSDGNHILYIIDGNGCEYSQDFTIPLHPISIFSIDIDNACGDNEMGTIAIIPVTEGLLFSIDSDDEFVDSLIYRDLEMGSHLLYSLSLEGCMDSIDFMIESISVPTVELEPISACEGLELGGLQIDSSNTGNLFALDGGDFLEDLYYADISHGQHILYYQFDQSCVFEYPFEIELIAEPEVELLSIESCKNEANGEIRVTTENSNFMFSIDKEVFVEDPQFTSLEPGDYIVYVQNEQSCIYEFPISIIEIDLPSISATTQNSCTNVESGIIEVSLLNDDQLISINDGDYTSKINYYDLSAGIYTIEAIDSNGCSNQEEVEILENPELVVEVSVGDADCSSEPIMITPEIRSSFGAINYIWQDGTIGDSYLANQTGLVTLEVSDECQTLDFEWDLTFALNQNENNIYIPNIFSPNNDGVNDCFISKLSPDIDLIAYHQIIYDRWGNKMFESDDITVCWDGIFLEELVVPGVYVYINEINVNTCGGEMKIRKVGDVTVIR